MLGSLRQSCTCTCSCLLQNNTPGLLFTPVRKYESQHTAVFERMHAVGRVGAGKYPLLKRRHYILKKLPLEEPIKKTMQCILTKEIDGVGLKGTVVEVKKSLFRNKLYPKGHAVYASPENIATFQAARKKSEEEGITYEMKQLMLKMARFHLRVFMNGEIPWTLTAAHLRIAFRKMGVVVKEENIILPDKPVTEIGEFTFTLQMYNRIGCYVGGRVYPIGDDGLPSSDSQYPEMWNNKLIDPANPTFYLKKKAAAKGDKEQSEEGKAEASGETSEDTGVDLKANAEVEEDENSAGELSMKDQEETNEVSSEGTDDDDDKNDKPDKR